MSTLAEFVNDTRAQHYGGASYAFFYTLILMLSYTYTYKGINVITSKGLQNSNHLSDYSRFYDTDEGMADRRGNHARAAQATGTLSSNRWVNLPRQGYSSRKQRSIMEDLA